MIDNINAINYLSLTLYDRNNMDISKENVDFIQSACNPVAVANTFAEWVKAEYRRTNDMESIRDNDLLLAVLGKLCSMFNLEHDGTKAYRYIGK